MNTFIKLLVSGILSLGVVAGVQQTPISTQLENKEVTQTTNTSQKITSQEAKQIALDAVDGIFKKIIDDNDEYDIYIQKGQYIYEIDVNKNTGKITSMDTEVVKTTSNTTTQSTNQTTSKTNSSTTKSTKTTSKNITLAKAKEVALKNVNGKIITTKTDSDDYDITIQKGQYVYEIEVNKRTGKITDIDKEKTKSMNIISSTKAKQIAQKRVNGTVQSVEYDADDCEYSVEIMKNNVEYEVTIHAETGKVLEVEKD